eukprot:g29487.t1
MDLALPAPRSLPLWRPCDYSNRQRSKRHGPRPYRLFGGACVGILGCRRRYAAGLVQRYVAAAATEAQECEVLELVNTDLCEGVSRAEQLEAAHEAEFQPPSELDLVLRAVRYYTELLLSYVPVYVQGYFSGHEGTLETQWQERHKAVGQVIATRSDLFPQEYSRQCASMIDSVNPLPFPVVRKVVEDELLGGLPLEEVFEFFEEEPLGSASIAQVHRAKLQTGREAELGGPTDRPLESRSFQGQIDQLLAAYILHFQLSPGNVEKAFDFEGRLGGTSPSRSRSVSRSRKVSLSHPLIQETLSRLPALREDAAGTVLLPSNSQEAEAVVSLYLQSGGAARLRRPPGVDLREALGGVVVQRFENKSLAQEYLAIEVDSQLGPRFNENVVWHGTRLKRSDGDASLAHKLQSIAEHGQRVIRPSALYQRCSCRRWHLGGQLPHGVFRRGWRWIGGFYHLPREDELQ